MGVEIERKFLVNHEKWNSIEKPEGETIEQKYIVNDGEKNIRVRIKGNKGFITIKSKKSGLKRSEFEYEIPIKDALELMNSFSGGRITKTRYKLKCEEKLWEVDEFHDENEGLIVAEIELRSEEETFGVPGWIEKEVTQDARYYNSHLAKKPFKSWNKT